MPFCQPHQLQCILMDSSVYSFHSPPLHIDWLYVVHCALVRVSTECWDQVYNQHMRKAREAISIQFFFFRKLHQYLKLPSNKYLSTSHEKASSVYRHVYALDKHRNMVCIYVEVFTMVFYFLKPYCVVHLSIHLFPKRNTTSTMCMSKLITYPCFKYS